MSNISSLLIITSTIITSILVISVVFFMRKLLRENMEMCRQLCKEQKLLAEKAFIQLKAQSVEQAVAASEAEIRYKLERDAAYDELSRHTKVAAEEYRATGDASISQQVFTDIEGNEYTRDNLDITWR